MRLIPKIKLLKIGIHLLMWGILLVFPYVLFPGQFKGEYKVSIGHTVRPVIEYIIIFYLNYFILIDRFIFRKRRYFIFLLLNVSIVLLFRFDSFIFQLFNDHTAVKPEQHEDILYNRNSEGVFNAKNIIALFVPAIFSVAIKVIEKWSGVEAEKKDIVNRNLQTELQNLKYQLQPHFFFNSLNNIYTLVEISKSKAQEAIHSLSNLMRYLLYESSKEKIRLSDEINFLKKYIDLMELRHAESTTVTYHFPNLIPDSFFIAPLLFIPLIENSYKHGVSATHPSSISFELEVHNNRVTFKAANSNHPKGQGDKSGSGIGLDNLQKRLELIYPGKHTFKAEIKDGIYYQHLTIDLNNV